MAAKNSIRALGLSAFLTITTTIGAPVTLAKEGVRLAPYYDSVGVKTWCAGETEKGYKEHFTYSECSELFKMRYGYYSYRVSMLYNDTAKDTVTPQMHAAATDLAYNVGINAFKTSTMLRNFNAGASRAGCDAILLFKRVKASVGSPVDVADGKKDGWADCSLPAAKSYCGGVWERRVSFRNMCIKGIE